MTQGFAAHCCEPRHLIPAAEVTSPPVPARQDSIGRAGLEHVHLPPLAHRDGQAQANDQRSEVQNAAVGGAESFVECAPMMLSSGKVTLGTHCSPTARLAP